MTTTTTGTRTAIDAPADPDTVPLLAARQLLGARGIAHIEHDGQVYTLRLTRNNRLILTK